MITAAQADLAFSVGKILVLLIFLSVLSLNVVLLEVLLFSLKTCTYFLSFVQVKHSTHISVLRTLVFLPISCLCSRIFSPSVAWRWTFFNCPIYFSPHYWVWYWIISGRTVKSFATFGRSLRSNQRKWWAQWAFNRYGPHKYGQITNTARNRWKDAQKRMIYNISRPLHFANKNHISIHIFIIEFESIYKYSCSN